MAQALIPLKASIVIATYNCRAYLGALLSSLKRQTLPVETFEVIVVDDGSADGTWEFLEQFQKGSPFYLKRISQEKSGPGLARNRGAAEAKGEVLVFVDSDCTVPPEWLERLIYPFRRSGVSLVGGPELAHPEDSFLSKCFWFTMNSKLTTGGIRGRRGRKLGKYYPRSFNMAVSAKAFRAVGGIRQAAIYGEDIELSFMIRNRGEGVEFVESAGVYHRKKSGFLQFARQVFRIGRARFWLCRKHPRLAEPVYFLPSVWLIFFLSMCALSLLGIYPFWALCGILFLVAPVVLAAIVACLYLRTPLAFFPVLAGGIVQTAGYGAGFLTAAAGWVLVKKSDGKSP